MPAPQIELRHISYKAKPLYECTGCHIQEYGSSISKSLDMEGSTLFAKSIMDRQVVSNSHMPIGWSGHGLSEHYCPECINSSAKQ